MTYHSAPIYFLKLTCVTSGAPTTSVHWEFANKREYQFEVTVDPVRLLYNKFNKLAAVGLL